MQVDEKALNDQPGGQFTMWMLTEHFRGKVDVNRTFQRLDGC